jgi:hypothetical protein
MNCHDFETIAGDLARERLMDAAHREKALAHSASCARCALRLADEQALTGGLRFVTRTSNEEAPARVEAALLAAFREQRAAMPSVAPAQTSRRRPGTLWLYAAASVAAIALIVTLLALATSRARFAKQPAPQEAANPGPSVPDQPRQPSPTIQALPSTETEAVAINAREQRRRSADRIRSVGRAKPPANDVNKPVADEIATEFIPLMNREALAQMDGGQVMRVELPRSALMSFGLPMDMERATERIKADVLVGNDGLARAIRFVR